MTAVIPSRCWGRSRCPRVHGPPRGELAGELEHELLRVHVVPPSTSVSLVGRLFLPRFDAAREWSPAITGPSTMSCMRCAIEVASTVGATPSFEKEKLGRDGQHRRRPHRLTQGAGGLHGTARPSLGDGTTRSAARAAPLLAVPSTPSTAAAAPARSASREPITTSYPASRRRAASAVLI